MDLFHFTGAKNFLQIISSNNLNFSLSCNLDDPFERRRYSFMAGTGGSKPPNDILNSFLFRMDNFCEYTKVLCFIKGNQNYNPKLDLKMWSHYGKWHQGICFSIDYEKIVDYLINKYTDHVFYDDVEYKSEINREIEYPLFNFSNATEEAEKYMRIHYKRMFFQKHNRYLEEKEFRFVVLDFTDIIFGIEINKFIPKVTFGENTNKWYEKRISKKLVQLGISYNKMGLDNSTFREFELKQKRT